MEFESGERKQIEKYREKVEGKIEKEMNKKGGIHVS